MPSAAPKPCSYAGCGRLVRGGGSRCEAHPVEVWTKRDNSPSRITGRRLQAARAELFRRCPLCVECEARGVVSQATQRDHIVPLSEGGTDTDDNVQALCDECHEVKSKAESARARARAGAAGGGARGRSKV